MKKNEELLASWLKLSSTIRNDRMPNELSYNEIHICNILYHNQMEEKKEVNATDLCFKTGLLKSQMNKVLTGLEKKKMITRSRSESDRRKIYIYLKEDAIDLYVKEHDRILVYVDELMKRIGEEDTKEAIRIFELISTQALLVMDELKGQNRNNRFN